MQRISSIGISRVGMSCVLFDLETTSLCTATAEIVEIAALAFDYDSRTRSGPKIVSEFSSLVKPVFNNPAAVKIHHISDAMLASEPSIAAVGASFLAWLDTVPTSKRCWVGHNIRHYDLPILQRCLHYDKRISGRCFDTLEVAEAVYPNRRKKLVSLYNYLRPNAPCRAHRAMCDVRMNLVVAVDELQRLNA